MRKVHIAAALAAVALVGTAFAALVGAFDSNVEVNFGSRQDNPEVQLLLPDAKAGELRRLRTANESGGGVDLVELANGFTKEIHYTNYAENRRSREITYFPAAEGEKRGPISSERVFAAAGTGTAEERVYDRNGRLLRSGALYKYNEEKNKAWVFRLTIYDGQGKVKETQESMLIGHLLLTTVLREDGTVEFSKRFTSPGNDSYWQLLRFQEDGKTVLRQEDRSFGSYRVPLFYADGVNKQEVSEVGPGTRKVSRFLPDGRQYYDFDEYRSLGYNFVDFDSNGKPTRKRYFARIDGSKRADGKEAYILRWVEELDGEGKKTVRYQFDDNGRLQDLELHKTAGRPRRVDYRFENGVLVKRTNFNEAGTVTSTVEKPNETVSWSNKAAWWVIPVKPEAPADAINVDAEVSHGPY